MSEKVEGMFEERLRRYQAAMALEMPDRIPISAGSNYFSEVYAGHTKQQFIYDFKAWAEADGKFITDFPEVDNLRSGRFWAPIQDALGWNLYKLPGRELEANNQFQFCEAKRMKSDEYDLLINDRTSFFFDRFFPRAFAEYSRNGNTRSHMAFLKAGIALRLMGEANRRRSETLQNRFGMPLPMQGVMLAPFDYLADGLRGLNGIIMDIYRRPDKVLEACEAIVPDIVNSAISMADPFRRYPIFMPLHRGCFPFLSPEQFDIFYWPSFKKATMMLIDAGYKVRAYLEGDWGPNWDHFCEFPKGTILCDIDTQGDIVQAKRDLGGHHCIAGGMPDQLLILGSPEEVEKRAKFLCQTAGKDGGYIINGGCGIPYDTKPKNYRAMIDAVMKYGSYTDRCDFEVQSSPVPPENWIPPRQGVVTPWSIKRKDFAEIKGEEDFIRKSWEHLEAMAYNWFWTMVW
jgi:hypothetical protein